MLVYQPVKFQLHPKHEVLNPSNFVWNAPYIANAIVKNHTGTVCLNVAGILSTPIEIEIPIVMPENFEETIGLILILHQLHIKLTISQTKNLLKI